MAVKQLGTIQPATDSLACAGQFSHAAGATQLGQSVIVRWEAVRFTHGLNMRQWVEVRVFRLNLIEDAKNTLCNVCSVGIGKCRRYTLRIWDCRILDVLLEQGFGLAAASRCCCPSWGCPWGARGAAYRTRG